MYFNKIIAIYSSKTFLWTKPEMKPQLEPANKPALLWVNLWCCQKLSYLYTRWGKVGYVIHYRMTNGLESGRTWSRHLPRRDKDNHANQDSRCSDQIRTDNLPNMSPESCWSANLLSATRHLNQESVTRKDATRAIIASYSMCKIGGDLNGS
jgi:hypothetical protein